MGITVTFNPNSLSFYSNKGRRMMGRKLIPQFIFLIRANSRMFNHLQRVSQKLQFLSVEPLGFRHGSTIFICVAAFITRGHLLLKLGNLSTQHFPWLQNVTLYRLCTSDQSK